MKRVAFIFTIIFLLTSCSIKAVNEKSVQRVSKVKYGDSKKVVIEKLGKPYKIDKLGNYHYKFCNEDDLAMRRLSHATLDIATLGLWEVIGTPVEKMTNCDRSIEVVILFNDSNKAVAVYSLEDYKILLSVYATLSQALKAKNSSNKYTLIYYADNVGWIYIYKNKIDCTYEGKYIKAYLSAVPSFSFALSSYLKTGKIPGQAMSVVLFDINKESYLEPETKYATLEGEVIFTEKSKEWQEVYPETIQEQLMEVLKLYCVSKILKEYKKAPEKPKMRIFPKTNQGTI